MIVTNIYVTDNGVQIKTISNLNDCTNKVEMSGIVSFDDIARAFAEHDRKIDLLTPTLN